MMDDTITTLLRGVADGSISVDDARTALEGAELTEDQMTSAIDHGAVSYTHLTLPTNREV